MSKVPTKPEMKCACGKEMHLSEGQFLLMYSFGYSYQDTRKVQVLGGKMYLVPMYYIIVHGIKAEEIAKLGFEEA